MCSLCNMCIALLLGSCATTPPARTTTWTEPTLRPRPGVIESVNEIAGEDASNPSGDALIALLVGGLLFSNLLFHHGTGVIVGAEKGTSYLAPSLGESTTLPRYQVVVRFDDGGSMT